LFTKLEPGLIEHIHDVLVGTFLPFDEHVSPAEYRSRPLIESAAARPFQTAFEQEVWPTLPQKAAALFHSLACNHCFINGNKRTAVIGLDIFLALNGHLLTMTSEEIYALAKETAKANQKERAIDSVMEDLAEKISASTVNIKMFENDNVKRQLGDDYDKIVAHVQLLISFVQKLAESSQHSVEGIPTR
jgi:death-on-curing protein